MSALGAFAVMGSNPVHAQSSAPIVVASKSDTEGVLIGSLISLILEGLGLRVERKLGLGPTLIVRSALLAGEVDIYPEYTGNAAFFSGTETDVVWKTGESGYARARSLDAGRGLVWLKPAPANNTWLIAVRGSVAREHGLITMADFAGAVQQGLITLAASTEFVESPAALPSFEAAYGFTMPASRIVSLPGGDTAVTARAAAEGISGVNAGMVYGTDGALAALDLTVMSDPKGAQIVYEVAPVIRADILARHRAIGDVLAQVFVRLNATTLRRLNARITVDGETADEVARGYLAEMHASP
ncbi:glycine betaine ABC transporter substrate-binding protein [Methylobacterium gnaphalii]|nr:glycine betaine ABC transporter substrate-binding protein [Methylobacterium gnaphalii]